MKKINVFATIALALVGGIASAGPIDFKIGNAGGMKVSQVFAIDNDAAFENFTGQTHNVQGSIAFDPQSHKGGGKITVDLSSIDTGIAMRNEHMRGEMWLNTAKFPTATFETTQVRYLGADRYRVSGKLTLHGVTRPVSTEATVKYIKQSEATKKAMFTGDVLQLKTDFSVKLSDFGVMIPDMVQGKVSDTLHARLVVFGYSG